jgi:hypothetical protein
MLDVLGLDVSDIMFFHTLTDNHKQHLHVARAPMRAWILILQTKHCENQISDQSLIHKTTISHAGV